VCGDICVACITARTKEFARASATSLRFLSNGGTPLLSRTLHDYVHFLPLPREYVRTYICTYVCSAGTGFDAFQRTRLLFRLHSARTEREPDAIASAMHLSIVRTGRKFFLFPRRSFYDVHSYSRRRRQVGTLLRLEKLPVDLYLRGWQSVNSKALIIPRPTYQKRTSISGVFLAAISGYPVCNYISNNISFWSTQINEEGKADLGS